MKTGVLESYNELDKGEVIYRSRRWFTTTKTVFDSPTLEQYDVSDLLEHYSLIREDLYRPKESEICLNTMSPLYLSRSLLGMSCEGDNIIWARLTSGGMYWNIGPYFL